MFARVNLGFTAQHMDEDIQLWRQRVENEMGDFIQLGKTYKAPEGTGSQPMQPPTGSPSETPPKPGSHSSGVNSGSSRSSRGVQGEPQFFEEQRGAHCGMHALNNVLGSARLDIGLMRTACQDVVRDLANGPDGWSEDAGRHGGESGWYSADAMFRAVQNLPPVTNVAPLGLNVDARPLYSQSLNRIFDADVVGVIVHQPGMLVRPPHWIALKVVEGRIWLLDSQDHPRLKELPLETGEQGGPTYLQLIQYYQESYAVVKNPSLADNGGEEPIL